VRDGRAERRRVDKLRRKGKLKYIREEQFLNVKGDPYRLRDENGTDTDASVKDVLRLLLEVYQPSQELTLQMTELRAYNKVLDVLEDGPQEDGHLRFEDVDFDLLKKLALHYAPLVLIRNAPLVEDLLNSASTSINKPVELVKEQS